MARIFILIVLAWILYQLIKRMIANMNAQNANKTEQNVDKKTDEKTDEKIVQCTQCGCHVPETDTKIIKDKIICNNTDCIKASNGN